MVIRNLRRFTEAQHAHEYPLCSRLIADFERKEVLYLAGLFHDIAKGRGGDHSTLGARDARRFCRAHGLPREDAELVAWLVEQHLMMSSTAQKQDISDPDVVAAFASKVGTERRLIALYLLTVADIRGTSPKVWNAWKAQAARGPVPRDARACSPATTRDAHAARTACDARQREAQRLLRLYAVPDGAEQRAVAAARHASTSSATRADEIAWHARHLYWRVDRHRRRSSRRGSSRDGAGLQVLVYLPDQKELFARICGFFGRARLSILEAKIHTTRHGYALDTFAVHDPAQPERVVPRRRSSSSSSSCTRVLDEQAPLEPPADGPRQPAAAALPADARSAASSPTTRARTTSSRSSPATGRDCSRDRLHAREGERQRRQRQDQHAGRARRGRLPDRRRAAARRAGAAAARDGALRAAAGLQRSAAPERRTTAWSQVVTSTLPYCRRARSTPSSRCRTRLRRRASGNRMSVKPKRAHVAHAHRIQDAVQVVALVLDDARVEAARPRARSACPCGSKPS